MTLRDARRAVAEGCGCRCDTARKARKIAARSYVLGYTVGFEDLFAGEVAARGGSQVVSIEELKAARVSRAAVAVRPAVND